MIWHAGSAQDTNLVITRKRKKRVKNNRFPELHDSTTNGGFGQQFEKSQQWKTNLAPRFNESQLFS
jgi:hypothetical protein